MANILDIRRRIRSVINTRQITKAMKMVSAAKLRRAQERALAARPYAQMLTNVLKSLVSRAEIYDPETGEPRHPLLAQRPERNVLLIAVTGDKGLAGAFNTNILKAAMQFIGEKSGKNIEIETIGRKGRDFLRRRFVTGEPRTVESNEASRTIIIGERVGVFNKIDHALATEIAKRVIERYANEEIDAVYLIYNEFKTVMSQKLAIARVLPVEMPREQQPVDYIFEQPPAELLESLLPRYVEMEIYHALLESAAAEHAARMTAMESATSNAAEMIEHLTLYMNRVRQASITKEIIEVVSGALALE